MTSREKIIVGVTAAVAVIGLWIGLGGDGSRGRPGPAPAANVAAKARGMEGTLRQSALNPVEKTLVTAIVTDWPAASLYDRPFANGGKAQPVLLPRYSGFVELGSGRLAVLDGMEYQVGDTLDSGGYKVVSIAPDKVGLESLANGQRTAVPYEGQEAEGR